MIRVEKGPRDHAQLTRPAVGDADHALRDAGGLALFFGEAPVRGARRVGDGGLGVAEVGGDRADARAVDDVEGVAARLRRAARRIGVDVNLLSAQVGHA